MSKRHKLHKEIAELTEGVLETVTDLTLFFVFFGFGAAGKSPTSRGVWQAYDESFGTLEGLNYQIIKRTLYNLKSRGLIQYTQDTITHPLITKQGIKRLESTLPSYSEKRVWDGKIYIVTYDIPEEERGHRDELRKDLKKIGCGMLQNSVWITPYNPKGVLANFIKQRNLKGAVIVSAVGDKDSVGDETLQEIVSRVYKLDELHERYLEFISKYSKQKTTAFEFLSILQDDPQLPFKLLPSDWAGDDAYKIFKKTTGLSQVGDIYKN